MLLIIKLSNLIIENTFNIEKRYLFRKQAQLSLLEKNGWGTRIDAGKPAKGLFSQTFFAFLVILC